MDLASMAQNVVQLLLPALPWLVKGGKALGQAAAEKGGEELAVTLWDKLRGNKRVLEAAQDVVADSQDEDAQGILVTQVKRVLKKDEALQKEIVALLEKASAGTNSGSRNVSIGGNVSGSTIIAGDSNVVGSHNVVQHGKYNFNAEQISGAAIGDGAKVEQR